MIKYALTTCVLATKTNINNSSKLSPKELKKTILPIPAVKSVTTECLLMSTGRMGATVINAIEWKVPE